MIELSYVTATEKDILPIIGLSRALIEKYEDLSSIDYPKVLRWVESKIHKNIKKYKAIVYNDEIVGYYRLDLQDDKWELDDFYILPQFRNKGIGSAVLSYICQSITGCIYLYVFTKNKGAISLYERFGFKRVQTVSNTRQIMERPG